MATAAELAAQKIYQPNVVFTTNALVNVKFIASCFAGAVAGTLGLENLTGFALFVLATLFSSACVIAINCRGQPKKYVQGGILELVNPGQENVFTFLLLWTLFYGIVHVYD